MRIRAPFILLGFASLAVAEGGLEAPSRVARASYVEGEVFLQPVSPQGAGPLLRNWPLSSGDRLMTGEDARMEIATAGAAIRLDSETDLTLRTLGDGATKVTLSAGVTSIHIRAHGAREEVVVEAPLAVIRLLHPGKYRIQAREGGDTTVVVAVGGAEVNTGEAAFQQRPGEQASINQERFVQISPPGKADDFDAWSSKRTSDLPGVTSARHVARGVVGFEDLDAHGEWKWEPDYGMVWTPKQIPNNWAPYRFGRWAWIQPWGWTWVDDAPWGFAPFHYGRWVQVRDRQWSWIPGPRQIEPVYAPALVAWLLPRADSALPPEERRVGWFALGPGENYIPAHPASARYRQVVNTFTNVLAKRPDASAGTTSSAPSAAYVHSSNPDAVTWMPRRAFATEQRTSALVRYTRPLS